MIKYVVAFTVALSSAALAILNWSTQEEAADVVGLNFHNPISPSAFKKDVSAYFQVDALSLNLNGDLVVFEVQITGEDQLNNFLALSQKINTARLHSINILPGDKKFTYALTVAYALN